MNFLHPRKSNPPACFGEEKNRPRGLPGSRRRVRHIPIQEPLSFIARQRQNNRAAPTQHHRKNFGKISRCCSASLSGFVTAAAIYSRWPATDFLAQKDASAVVLCETAQSVRESTAELNGCRYLLRSWPSAAFAVASNAVSSLSFRSLRKRRILRNDWRKKRSAAWFVCGAGAPFRRAN
jgi:hypothetical protein